MDFIKNKGIDIKFGVKLPFSPLEKIYETANLAEKLNFDSIWSPDHLTSLNPNDLSAYSVWCILSTVARETRNCIIGTSVTDCLRLNVAVLAQISTTIQEISGGRFILGIGIGEAQNTVPYGIPCDKKTARLTETITGIRLLWSQEEVNFAGNFVKLNSASVMPLPSQRIPIWIGANSINTIKLTFSMGDGWLPLAIKFSPAEYSSILETFGKTSRKQNSFTPALFVHTLAEKYADDAWKKVKEMGKMLLVLWKPEIFKQYGIEISDDFYAHKFTFSKQNKQRLLDLLKTLPDDPLYENFIVGGSDDCIEKIEKYVKAGVDHFVLSIMVDSKNLPDSINYYKKAVVDYFKGG